MKRIKRLTNELHNIIHIHYIVSDDHCKMVKLTSYLYNEGNSKEIERTNISIMELKDIYVVCDIAHHNTQNEVGSLF